MKHRIAKSISYISDPLFLATPIPFLLVLWASEDVFYSLKWSVFSMMFFAFIGLFVLYGVKRNVFSDVDVSKREQRPAFYAFAVYVCLLYLGSLLLLDGPPVLFLAGCGVLLSIVAITIVNLKIKASVHVATVTALIFIVSILYGDAFLFFLLFIPLIIWSRIVTKRHTMQEAVIGGSVGVILTLIVYVAIKLLIV